MNARTTTTAPRITRLGAPALAALVVALLLLGGTFALWAADARFVGGTITSGDLALEVGVPTWEQVTPGVAYREQGVFDGTVPAAFFTKPGDVVEIAQPVTTTLVGDNLAGGFGLRPADRSRLADDIASGRIAVTFSVRDDAGTTIAPEGDGAELGETVVVPGLAGSGDEGPQDWVVVIRVEVLGEYVWTDGHPVDAAGVWSSGGLVISLEQVREGDGFRGGAE
ncbi:hypothetical protein [Cellulomonas sp. Y8]|uniref:hypothetical protein n=1 Tax=Cellulomonas sp. Y8 TaxID=2591145 RepID=UPI0011C91D52|nr:hypothetical protein [Cellulomonas sp. Y8]